MTGEALNSTDPEPDPSNKEIEIRSFVSPGIPLRRYNAKITKGNDEVEATIIEDSMGAGDPVATISVTGLEGAETRATMEIETHEPAHVNNREFVSRAAPLIMDAAAVNVVDVFVTGEDAVPSKTLQNSGMQLQANGRHVMDFRPSSAS